MGHGSSDPRLIPPAEGERRAVSGYGAQYRVAAWLVYRSLRDRKLDWVRVADPEAGRTDDLVIGGSDRVDSFQVKWSQYGGTFTFNDLVAISAGKPPLIAQLADGWLRLRKEHPGSRVVVHLVTNNARSVSDAPPALLPLPVPRHFAAFHEQAWTAVRDTPGQGVRAEWQPAWKALESASGLSAPEFARFVLDCELDFGFQMRADLPMGRDESTVHLDVAHLARTLQEAVASPARVIELGHAQLLSRLGWTRRVELNARHSFPDPEVAYRPVEAARRQLEGALIELSGGYIGVFGTPGSGKSALLTQTLRYRQERVIRYYAFVPDAHDPAVLRGESEIFLHDMVVMLEEHGFRAGAAMPGAMGRPRFDGHLDSVDGNNTQKGRGERCESDGSSQTSSSWRQ